MSPENKQHLCELCLAAEIICRLKCLSSDIVGLSPLVASCLIIDVQHSLRNLKFALNSGELL